MTRLPLASRQRILARLAVSRRMFDRLDWWTVEQWAGSPAMLVQDDAALMILPPDLSPGQEMNASCLPAAWLRWGAVADGSSASPVLPRLLDHAHAQLMHAGITEALAIVHPQDWLLGYLQDAGYAAIDRMLTYEAAPARIDAQPAMPNLSLRRVLAQELHTVCALDTRSFEPAWRYPPAIMQPAFEACAVFTLAEWHGEPVGYCCALLNDEHGHVVRLAVDEKHRRAGIGAALLGQVVQALGRQGALTVSLNTQGANKVSQRVYLRMGFSELLERPMVLRKQLAQHTGGAQA